MKMSVGASVAPTQPSRYEKTINRLEANMSDDEAWADVEN